MVKVKAEPATWGDEALTEKLLTADLTVTVWVASVQPTEGDSAAVIVGVPTLESL